jgi:hypothetical protein
MLWIERSDTSYIRTVADNIEDIGADSANQVDRITRKFGL